MRIHSPGGELTGARRQLDMKDGRRRALGFPSSSLNPWIYLEKKKREMRVSIHWHLLNTRPMMIHRRRPTVETDLTPGYIQRTRREIAALAFIDIYWTRDPWWFTEDGPLSTVDWPNPWVYLENKKRDCRVGIQWHLLNTRPMMIHRRRPTV